MVQASSPGGGGPHASTHPNGQSDEIANALALGAIPTVHQTDVDQITSTFSTTSTSFVDVTGLAITMTTGANPILIILSTPQYSSGVYAVYFRVDMDGTNILTSAYVHDAGAHTQQFAMAILKTPSAGAHTFKVQMRVGAGTGYCEALGGANLAYPTLIVIELKK